MLTKLKRIYYRVKGINPGQMPMVSYWKTQESVEGKLTVKNGAAMLYMNGEKYPMWGVPRGHLLIPQRKGIENAKTLEERIEKFGPFSVLKHECKEIFNEVWRKLDAGIDHQLIIEEAKQAIDKLPINQLKYDLVSEKAMCPSVREIYRAWTKVAPSERSLKVRDILTFILQEDDGYRYRVQWMIIWWPLIRFNPIKVFLYGLRKVEEGEIIGDMKRKMKLLRRGLELLLEDYRIKELFIKFFKEVNWKKVKITEMDRYHFRGKYFKCDLDLFEY